MLEARGAPFHAPEALDEIALKSLDSAAARLVARCGRAPWRYRELLDRWRRGELVTFPFSTDAIRKASRTSAELGPEKPA